MSHMQICGGWYGAACIIWGKVGGGEYIEGSRMKGAFSKRLLHLNGPLKGCGGSYSVPTIVRTYKTYL